MSMPAHLYAWRPRNRGAVSVLNWLWRFASHEAGEALIWQSDDEIIRACGLTNRRELRRILEEMRAANLVKREVVISDGRELHGFRLNGVAPAPPVTGDRSQVTAAGTSPVTGDRSHIISIEEKELACPGHFSAVISVPSSATSEPSIGSSRGSGHTAPETQERLFSSEMDAPKVRLPPGAIRSKSKRRGKTKRERVAERARDMRAEARVAELEKYRDEKLELVDHLNAIRGRLNGSLGMRLGSVPRKLDAVWTPLVDAKLEAGVTLGELKAGLDALGREARQQARDGKPNAGRWLELTSIGRPMELAVRKYPPQKGNASGGVKFKIG